MMTVQWASTGQVWGALRPERERERDGERET